MNLREDSEIDFQAWLDAPDGTEADNERMVFDEERGLFFWEKGFFGFHGYWGVD